MTHKNKENTKKQREKEVTNMLEQLEQQQDPKIRRIDDQFYTLNDIEFKIIENYQEAFDLEMLEERYTDYLLKYDYIVGDIAYDKLRLRGFYEDYRRYVPLDMKISNVEDYLIEYCSFGAAYFILERVEKKKEDPEPYFGKKRKSDKGRRRGRRRPRKQNRNKKGQQNQVNQSKVKDINVSEKKKNVINKKQKNKAFQVVKTSKDEKEINNQNKKEKQRKGHFTIRKR